MATSNDSVDLPSGTDLKERWRALSRPAQGELERKMRRGETSEDEHEALLIAALVKQRLGEWTLRPEIALPVFVAFFALLSLLWDDFSLVGAMTAPLLYAGYLFLVRSLYNRAYSKSIDRLTRGPSTDG